MCSNSVLGGGGLRAPAGKVAVRAVSELEVRPGMNRRKWADSTHAAVDNKIEWNSLSLAFWHAVGRD